MEKSASVPRVQRIEADIELEAPDDCYASVLLRLIDAEDDDRYFTWWAVVGRSDSDMSRMSYSHTIGAVTIRIDLPEGKPLSASSLEPDLAAFLKSAGVVTSSPPIIRP